jgi:hypothetical protein
MLGENRGPLHVPEPTELHSETNPETGVQHYNQRYSLSRCKVLWKSAARKSPWHVARPFGGGEVWRFLNIFASAKCRADTPARCL